MAKQWHRDWSVMVSPWPPNKSVSEFEYRYTRRISSEGSNVCVVVVSRASLYIPIPPGVLSYSFLSSFFHRHDFFLARSFALRSKVWITFRSDASPANAVHSFHGNCACRATSSLEIILLCSLVKILTRPAAFVSFAVEMKLPRNVRPLRVYE